MMQEKRDKMKHFFTLFLLTFLVLPLSSELWLQDSMAENQNNSPATETIRYGFTQSTLGTVNENDAGAAVRVWTQSLTRELNLPAHTVIHVYSDFSEFKKDLESNRLDITYVTAPEWFALRRFMAEDKLLTVEQSGTVTEKYILLVHGESGYNSVQDLKGKNLIVLDNTRASLAWPWFSDFLEKKGLAAKDFFATLKFEKKLTNAVLPVFFKQTDACLVTRKGFETMSELNPQISQQLKIMEESGFYIPAVLGFRKGYQSPLKDLLLNNMPRITQSASGRQLLTIFQSENIRQISIKDLAGISDLFENDKNRPGAGPLFFVNKDKGRDN